MVHIGDGHFGGGYEEQPLTIRDLEAAALKKEPEKPRDGDPKVWEQRKRKSGP